ncbi:hypothetical protein [Parablautia muri]|uniref:Ferritin-like domain-containing protein n=1 Tax=Parablautia muri TaxID=2320879 RepID=A0A9X5BG89_9FIRM|nr:hypothetical protein [Parablautia muri]
MVDFKKSKMNRFTYKEWNDYFSRNDKRRLKIDFSQEKNLPEAVRRRIFPSVREFQKGEGSDGKYLMERVEIFADENQVPEYKEAMERFVREENWHSAYMKKYMDFHHVGAKETSFLDRIFRSLRRLGGVKCEVTVLVTAEMIALTYYDALSRNTDSIALKSICKQMLHDEIPHVMFQSYTLSHFQNNLPDKLMWIILMEVTLLFVWGAFRNVYRSGGYDFSMFLKENMGYLQQSIELVDTQRR